MGTVIVIYLPLGRDGTDMAGELGKEWLTDTLSPLLMACLLGRKGG